MKYNKTTKRKIIAYFLLSMMLLPLFSYIFKLSNIIDDNKELIYNPTEEIGELKSSNGENLDANDFQLKTEWIESFGTHDYDNLPYDVIDESLIGDFNGDGSDEIFLYLDGKVYGYNRYGLLMNGWPQAISNAPPPIKPNEATPALGDIDGDGFAEIVINSNDGKVYAWHFDGTAVEGWPKIISPLKTDHSSPLLADFDSDELLEIVIVGYTSSSIDVFILDYSLHC